MTVVLLSESQAGETYEDKNMHDTYTSVMAMRCLVLKSFSERRGKDFQSTNLQFTLSMLPNNKSVGTPLNAASGKDLQGDTSSRKGKHHWVNWGRSYGSL